MRDAEIKLSDKQLKVEQITINAAKESLLLQADKNKKDAKALANIEKQLKSEIAAFNQEKQINDLRIKQIEQLDAKKDQSSIRNVKRVDANRKI